jgi:transcriptional regulator with XRE-family HTH domain
MNYFECVSGLRILGRPGQRQTLAACRTIPHPAYVDTQNPQKKRLMEALGAQIALLRQRAGMPTQADLYRASGVGVRTISDIETGRTIPRIGTMRKIETALNLPPGSTDDFLSGKIKRLVPADVDEVTDSLYERIPRDEVEQAILDLDDLPEDNRWAMIFKYRKKNAAKQHGQGGSPFRQRGA